MSELHPLPSPRGVFRPEWALPAALAAAETVDSSASPPAMHAQTVQRAWSELRDAPGFAALLTRLGLTHLQALVLVAPRFAEPIESCSAHQILCAASRERTPIRVLVRNAGILQTYAGTIGHIRIQGPWLQVQDPHFRLQVREADLAQAWIMRRPTVQGLVTSLEFFDRHGQHVMRIGGERHAGRPECCAWRSLVDTVILERSTCTC